MRLGRSRRIRLRIFPAYTRPFWQRLNKWLVFGFVLVSLFMCYRIILAQIRPVISSIAQEKAYEFANLTVNEAVAKKMQEQGIAYDQLVDLQKAPDGTVCAISSNIATMNELKSTLAVDIQNRLMAADCAESSVSLGTLLGKDLLVGWGPKVPIRMFQTGYTEIDFKNSFTSAGINQTYHQIYIEVKTNIGMIYPTGNETTAVSCRVPVAETVIVGTVPNSFTNIEGTTGTPQDQALELVN